MALPNRFLWNELCLEETGNSNRNESLFMRGVSVGVAYI